MKQNLGSKKKARRASFLSREEKRNRERTRIKKIAEAHTIKEMAEALGVKLD